MKRLDYTDIKHYSLIEAIAEIRKQPSSHTDVSFVTSRAPKTLRAKYFREHVAKSLIDASNTNDLLIVVGRLKK